MLETRPWRAEPLRPIADRAWDGFLKTSNLGQFQQSAGWAGGKREQGWSVHRVHFCCEGHPNELLTLAEIQWALESGYSCCDFGAFDRVAAEWLLAGERLRQDAMGGRYSLLLQFGGQPKLLPRPRFYSPTRFVRWLHRVASRLARGSHG